MDPIASLSEGFGDLSVSDKSESLTRVSPERDSFDDDDHKQLDAQIEKLFSAFRKINEEPNLPGLLWVIILTDKRLVKRTEEEVEELLTSHPSINLVLQKAWEEASFKEVRKLSVLWPVVQKSRMDVTTRALRSAWLDNYSGNNHRLLLANLNAIPSTKQVYSNQIVIVQSSGTGKSRMVHEQANLVFTIPFNLRERGDNQDLAFPSPDDAVRDYLLHPSLLVDERVLKTYYLKFLGKVFTQVLDELERCQAAVLEKQVTTAEDLATWWSRHLKGRRTELYTAAIEGTGIPNQTGYRRPNPEDSDDFAAAEAARATLNKLISKLDGWPGKQNIKLIIYFDEAHPLTKVGPKNDRDDGKTNYDWLRSCLNQFLDFPMFCIFLSTNPSLSYFVAPRPLAPSARIRGGKATLHAPITETPFDCCETLMVDQGQFSMDDISTIPFMAQFGRPLFWALLRGAGLWESELVRSILDLAREKLVASRHIDSDYYDFSRTAKLAVLDVQLSLDFEPRREEVQIEEARLVESHMRIAFSIPDHREYLRSGYPSEPLLAEAAAQQLWMWRKRKPFIVVETLTDMVRTELLDRGELGELTGRQLLLDAYHRAVELEHSKKSPPSPPNFSAGCGLISFINTLFTDECAAEVLDSKPDNMEGKSFTEIFKDAHICFTHFGKMADDTGVTSTVAWAAFIRHMAIMCRNNDTVDCIIPVALCSRDVKLCEHVMTGVLVQFKRRVSAGTKYSIDQVQLNFFPGALEKCTHRSDPNGDQTSDQTSYRPYVSLIMELGVQPKGPEEAKTAAIGQSGTPGGPHHTTPSEIHLPQHEVGHARYSVFAYGASPTIYRGVDAAHKDSYALLLSPRDFLEHPRRDAETLKAMRRMKPFWHGGDDCYHWVRHNDALHGPAPRPMAEFVVGNEVVY